MELGKAKELSARIMKVGVNRIYIDPAQTAKVAEAMTKEDLKGLIADRVIKKRRAEGQSMGRARAKKAQKKKGRSRGKGRRSGTKKVRMDGKSNWIKRVRAQRTMLKELKKTNPKAVEELGYSNLYGKIKGNYFKGKNYLKEYVEGTKKK